jgi:hypothetical protein
MQNYKKDYWEICDSWGGFDVVGLQFEKNDWYLIKGSRDIHHLYAWNIDEKEYQKIADARYRTKSRTSRKY